MEINNFELIKNQMSFDSKDEFYFVQILVRKKDGGSKDYNANGNNRHRYVKMYCIDSVESLDKYKSEIITLCKLHNARAYIHPTKRSYKEVSKEALRLMLDYYLSEQYFKGVKLSYNTACGVSYIKSDKKFIVDIDDIETFEGKIVKIDTLMRFLRDSLEPIGEQKVLYTVPTKSGIHLICRPFNVEKFKGMFPEIDVHTNNPTLLYYSKED